MTLPLPTEVRLTRKPTTPPKSEVNQGGASCDGAFSWKSRIANPDRA